MTHKRDQGFSFIELLAYMAIAALLILAAIPQFNNYRGSARDASTVSDVRNIAVGLESWAISHPGEAYPSINFGWRGDPSWQVDLLADMGVTLTPGTRIWVADRVNYAAATTVTTEGTAYCIFAYNTDGRKYAIADRPGAYAYNSMNGVRTTDC